MKIKTLMNKIMGEDNLMKVNVKVLHKDAVIPSYAKSGDAGLDLTAVSVTTSDCGSKLIYDTGLAFEIPEGYAGFLFPRSSIINKGLSLANSVGVIDSGYRGPIKFVFNSTPDNNDNIYSIGDRVGQIVIMPYPKVELIGVEELSSSDRNTGGFGSTGK